MPAGQWLLQRLIFLAPSAYTARKPRVGESVICRAMQACVTSQLVMHLFSQMRGEVEEGGTETHLLLPPKPLAGRSSG